MVIDPTQLQFNSGASTVMHIDLNSCFATIEQQANPFLRGKPIAVAAYDSPGGCILAPSIEAKKMGVKTGMRVKDGRVLCPTLKVITPDPEKYREVHRMFRNILSDYTNEFYPKSIDEFVLHFAGYPAFKKGLFNVALDIKARIRSEIGEWISVSVGLAPNRFLAKTASNLKKPDGLEEINKENHLKVFEKLALTDLCGISYHNELRLKGVHIDNVVQFATSPLWQLKAAFKSINAYYWYVRLRGWEIDDIEFSRRSYGNSYALPHSQGQLEELAPILAKLTEKSIRRMRAGGYVAQGIHVSTYFRDHTYWHHGQTTSYPIIDVRDAYKHAFSILKTGPRKPVHTLAVSLFNLKEKGKMQLELFRDVPKEESIAAALDDLAERWGRFMVYPGRMANTESKIADRISFGGVKEL
jgi:DNA polymerase IV